MSHFIIACCSVLQSVAVCCSVAFKNSESVHVPPTRQHIHTLTTTQVYTVSMRVRNNTPPHTITDCNTYFVFMRLQNTAAHSNTLHHTPNSLSSFCQVNSLESCSLLFFSRHTVAHCNTLQHTSPETWGAGVETQENKKISVPLSKKDKNKKSHERWT